MLTALLTLSTSAHFEVPNVECDKKATFASLPTNNSKLSAEAFPIAASSSLEGFCM